jgi:hypothetical protein
MNDLKFQDKGHKFNFVQLITIKKASEIAISKSFSVLIVFMTQF